MRQNEVKSCRVFIITETTHAVTIIQQMKTRNVKYAAQTKTTRNVQHWSTQSMRRLLWQATVWLSLAEANVKIDKLLQSVNVLIKMFNVVVSCAINPQRLHSVWTTLVDGATVRKINHFVILSMYDQHWRCDPLHFVNTAQQQQQRDDKSVYAECQFYSSVHCCHENCETKMQRKYSVSVLQ